MRKYEVLIWNVDIAGPEWVRPATETSLADVVDNAIDACQALDKKDDDDELHIVTVVRAPA